MTSNKTCRKCGRDFPATLEFFYRNSGGKYGLTPRCKPCVNQENIERHARSLAENPEKIRAQANARSKKHYHSDLERSRGVARASAAKARRDPEKRARINARKRASGANLSPEEIESIFKSQGSCCAICRSADPGSKIGWNLDHCHKTGVVRFVLCAHCNRGLGAFKDDPALMRRAADILEQHQYQSQADTPVSAIMEG